MQLNYKSFGEGIPVVILHGLLGSLDNWQTFARKLSADYKVYTVDLRNHGRSPHSDEHSFPAMAEDLIEFFAEHRIQAAHIIGHSMGGKTAMQFAIAHPEKVLKLIVVDIAPRSYDRNSHDNIFNALRSVNLSGVTRREEVDAALAPRITDFAERQFLMKNLDRNPDGNLGWKMNLEGLFHNYYKVDQSIKSDKPVNVPTFVIRGGKSRYVADDDLHAFRAIFPQTELITIPEAGHWVHAEAPERFYRAIQDILVKS